MSSRKDYLYIFVHLPKCAGSTICYHIEKNFESDEIIKLYEERISIAKDELAPHSLHKVKKYLLSIPEAKREHIKVIYGHGVPYGIHTLFKKPARYITLTREPLARTVSGYNFQRMQYEKQHKKSYRYQPHVTHQGEILSFSAWLETKYDRKDQIPTGMTLTHFLSKMKYLTTPQWWKKFYFVGLTENADDILFIYHLLHIKKFFFDKNISRKYVTKTEIASSLPMLKTKNSRDQILYLQSQTAHHRFLVAHPEYYQVVMKIKLQRALTLPLSVIWDILLERLYKLSAVLKRNSHLYAVTLRRCKKDFNRLRERYVY